MFYQAGKYIKIAGFKRFKIHVRYIMHLGLISLIPLSELFH